MGKGARSREKNAAKNAEQKVKAATEAKKKKKDRLIIGTVAGVVAAGLVIGGLVYGLYFGNGKYLRDNVTMSSANFKVDNAMMTYFFRNNFQSIQAGYSGYFEMFTNVDLNKSLKNQSYDESQSWFDYVLSSTKDAVEQLLVLAEEAKAQGMELTESDHTSIKTRVESLDASYFTDGVSKEDVIRAFEISTLAQKYTNQFEADTTFTDEELETYYGENENTYKTASYQTYTINYSATEVEGKVPYTAEQAKAKAEAIEKAGSEEEFLSLVEAAIQEQQPEITDEDLQKQLDSTTIASSAYTKDNEVSEWVFDSARKVGDVLLKANDENSTYALYYLTQLPVRDEEPTVNVRHILFTKDVYGSDNKAEEKAKEVLAMYEKNPDKAYFGELAAEYSEDGGSRSRNGRYTGVKNGDMVEAFNDWVFEASRKEGDTGIVKTDYGYHVMYFEGAGKAYWQERVLSDMRGNAFEAKIEELKAASAVTSVDDKLSDIPA